MADSPTPRPGGPAVPKPSAARPAPSPARPAPTKAAPAPGVPSLEEAKRHGRVDEDGTVFVRTAEGERAVGQYPDSTPEEALGYFARKFIELAGSVGVLRQRLAAGAPAGEVASSAQHHLAELPEANVVGDLDGLRATLREIEASCAAAALEQQEQATAAKAQAKTAKESLVARAEELAARDPDRVQWKTASQDMSGLFDEWKGLQSRGPRLPRSEDQELWVRFRAARSTFDNHRREFFAKLDERHAEGKRAKQSLIEEAERLSTSTNWRDTSQAYRDLMDRWKASPRAGRKHDDALWARFRAAQDVFFAAREADNAAQDEEFRGNLGVKEGLLTEAEALLPITSLDSAKRALRGIQDRWDEAGKVPRGDLNRVEARLRAVERAVSEAEDAQWKNSHPETRARAEGALGQLDDAIAALQAKVETAKASGDAKAEAKALESLEARKAWREQVARAASDLG